MLFVCCGAGMFKGKGAAALRQQRVRAATQPRLQ
jgi:hypothetical protein